MSNKWEELSKALKRCCWTNIVRAQCRTTVGTCPDPCVIFDLIGWCFTGPGHGHEGPLHPHEQEGGLQPAAPQQWRPVLHQQRLQPRVRTLHSVGGENLRSCGGWEPYILQGVRTLHLVRGKNLRSCGGGNPFSIYFYKIVWYIIDLW